MKLSQWAKEQGISYLTAYRWFKQGYIKNSKQTPSGTILVDNKQEEQNNNNNDDEVIIYCRVSSWNKKEDLERQLQRCKQFCLNKGFVVKKIIKEIASGMNDKRPKLIKLLQEKQKHIIVEYKDRLNRFGFNYIETLLNAQGSKITVINRDEEEKQDLIKDLISIITSFCCRLYGLRKGKNKIKQVKEIIHDNKSNSFETLCNQKETKTHKSANSSLQKSC